MLTSVSDIELDKHQIEAGFTALQARICKGLEELDGSGHVFSEEYWKHREGGGGRTRVFQNGNFLEKGGVNFSAVWGTAPELIQKSLQLQGNNHQFFASGVSIVLHPASPLVPIIHMNVRYFELSNGDAWFGGGIDLTPIYVVEEDARHFHRTLKKTCDAFDAQFYPKFKTWADDYFYLQHRNETRGVGGIFFDYLRPDATHSKQHLFDFAIAVGDTFVPVYRDIVERRRHLPFHEEHRSWQLLRRGRYAEFNLVWDKGTKFGLETGGRTESILMSLPPLAAWEYDYTPPADSEEAATLAWLKRGVDFV